ncbi:MAG: SURF1 family protein [Chloroflexi bacterium]|nr:SURF1 family protein [Chloroflexota bacterium]
MSQIGRMAKTFFSRQFILATAAVIAGMIFLARLGFWQLDRLEQRRVGNAQLQAVLDSQPLDLANESLPEDLISLKNREVVAQGAFDFDYQGFVKLQTYQGRSGVHLLAPLLLDGGETAVLVNRGWVPEADSYVAYDEPGPITIEGYIGLTQTLNRDRRETLVLSEAEVAAPTELAWYRVDIAAIQTQMPYDLLPMYINQSPAADQTQPPFRSRREVDLSEGSHLGYAIQWFLFSAILGVMYVAYVYKDSRNK